MVRQTSASPRARFSAVVAVVLPVGVACAWMPVRNRLPDLDLALVLVLVVMAAGWSGRRDVVLASAACAALAFEFFDTRPYGQLAIARQPDVETTIVLAVVGAIAGECAARMKRQRAASQLHAAYLQHVGSTAGLVASGEEVVDVVTSASRQLTQLLDLLDCRFEAVPLQPGTLRIERDGSLVLVGDALRHAGADPERPSGKAVRTGQVAMAGSPRRSLAELPVWGQGQVLGRFVLSLRPGTSLRREQLQVAVVLADQVGAAFAAYAPAGPPPPENDSPSAGLHLVR